jgi:hypothetical protein
VACGGNGGSEDSSESESECGDLDGPDGTDTGNIPDLLGNWTTVFGTEWFEESCGIADLHQTSETWISGGALEIEGRVPDNLWGTFSGASDETFWGVQSLYGGVVFSGVHDHSGGTLYVSFGGLAFYDVYRTRNVIEGFGYFGVDSNDDGDIDCDARGNFTAYKSGS